MANNLNTIKCPNCAAAIDISTAVGGVIKCKYCKQPIVLPKTTDNAACVALETANNFLNLCDFDRAYETYRSVADKFPDEPEAYFGMALAANKVRYINDIKNNCLQPICYNATNKNFASDGNYIKALTLATVEQKNEYMRRANEIDYIRNEFYKLKQSGKAYDCFICVKVSGEGGHKTIDSERANDIYYHLKDKGYRPFYSEREIQNETGADYEARILYALFSSPCMLVVCSDESYLQTPWVKNEYSRFISLINDEQKETNSIAIGFFDTPIERLPGRNGRLQGVCLKNPDAYSKIVDFVDKHYNLNAEAPQISRKTYSQVAYQKKSVVKSQIQKRTLAKFEQTAITVSEQSKLDIAKSMLDSGNFNAVISRCNSILETNKSCALAHWYMFLAENECRSGEEFEKSPKKINNFDSLELVIATDNNELRNTCYSTLYNRAMADRQLYIYNEYISLPDSSADSIKQLTAAMYNDLLESEMDNNTIFVFEALLKTVDNTDIYIGMNCGFADKMFDGNKEYAQKCYKSVINVDASNGHALWQLFRIKYNLNTATDVVAYLIFKENRGKIENEAFVYGFNQYAVEQMFEICLKNTMVAPQYNVVRFDFIFSLIPQSEKAIYNKYINEVTNSLLVAGQFTAANRYNDIIIAEDKYNDMAYFKRLYIKRKTLNPFEFAEDCDSLYDDSDFSAAVDAYAEKHIGEQNIYIELVKIYHKWNEKDFNLQMCFPLNKDGLSESISLTVNNVINSILQYQSDENASIIELLVGFAYYQCGELSQDVNNAESIARGVSKKVRRFDFNNRDDIDMINCFLRLFVTEKQIYEARKGCNTKCLAGGDSIDSLKDDYYDKFASSLFYAFNALIEHIMSGKIENEFDRTTIQQMLTMIDSPSRKLASRVAPMIRSRYMGGFNKLIEIAMRSAVKKASNVSKETQDSLLIQQVAGSETIYNNTFRNCKSLTNLIIPDSVNEIGSEAFSGCSQLAHIKLGNGVKMIGAKAFVDCTALTQISIPDSVTEIGGEAFSGCKSLVRLTMGRSVKSIGKDAFKECKKPEIYISDISRWCNIKFENDMLRLVNNIYLGDRLITDLVIPHNVERITAPLFGGCKHIKSVALENGVKQIGKLAFYECSEIERVTLPDSLLSIDESAFYRCAKITNLEIPNSVMSIGDKAFLECSGLTCVTLPKRFKKDRFRIFGEKRAIKHIKFAFTK